MKFCLENFVRVLTRLNFVCRALLEPLLDLICLNGDSGLILLFVQCVKTVSHNFFLSSMVYDLWSKFEGGVKLVC